MTQISVTYGEYGSLVTETYNVEKAALRFTPEGLKLFDLVQYLKENGVKLAHSMVLYYSQAQGMYVYCGNDPIDEETLIPMEECKSHEIAIKCRQPVFTDISPPVHLTRTSSGTA